MKPTARAMGLISHFGHCISCGHARADLRLHPSRSSRAALWGADLRLGPRQLAQVQPNYDFSYISELYDGLLPDGVRPFVGDSDSILETHRAEPAVSGHGSPLQMWQEIGSPVGLAREQVVNGRALKLHRAPYGRAQVEVR